jgi:hypothetical protein
MLAKMKVPTSIVWFMANPVAYGKVIIPVDLS